MSITDLTSINTERNRPTFDRFSIEKNSKARILLPSTRIASFYVHVFHSDEPEMRTNDYGRQVPKWDVSSFAGTYICAGDPTTIARNPRYGDPANCPACAAMNDPEKANLIEFPKQTFAMNIIEYTTRPGTYDLRNKNVEVKVWKHADMNKLQPIKLAASQLDDITKVDFLIESDNTEWKKLNINYSLGGAEYTKDEVLGSAVREIITNELYDEDTLTLACGKKLSSDEMAAEVNTLYGQFNSQSASAGTSNDDLHGLADLGGNTSGSTMDEVPADELSSLLD